MISNEIIEKNYKDAQQKYQEIGVDTEAALKRLQRIPISIHSWEGDDIRGFVKTDESSSSGIEVTGNYLGVAKTPDQLTSDLHEALSLIPGNKKVQLHSIYGVTDTQKNLVDVDKDDFSYWVDWAKEEKIGLDMNPTFFRGSMVKNNLTLSSPDKNIRDYWIEVGKKSREISNYFGKSLGVQSINNFWVPDGFKDNPIDKESYRLRLIDSLDEIISEKYPEENTIESFEGKLFAPGIEAFTVGSHLLYNNYSISRGKLWTIDSGHWHPTEDVSDKFSSYLPFGKGIMLHVSRPMRWDSDHVVILDDMLHKITDSLIRDNYIDRTHIGLDFFDATINRIAAWIVGARQTQKSLLQSLLTPVDQLKESESNYDFTKRLIVTEQLKTYPVSAVWDRFCQLNGVPAGSDWVSDVKNYTNDVLSKRN
ncbi:L-rhamnose isomerase [Companilactobacillus sp. HBUAS56257]|jgi:L-rhamnose isomerase|uniref:L-rhamnose isomerase n=1 Tax=Companilactobacillus sp. HBUAS56257 TaxID=3109360 RepID=UPI002FF08F50